MKQIKGTFLACLAGFFYITSACSQNTKAAYDSLREQLRLETAADYKHMLGQLGISVVRPGANGSDPEAENAANYDEAIANPYPDYPDPLLNDRGEAVSTAQDWENTRRPEILSVFSEEFYGNVPENVPTLTWQVRTVSKESEQGLAVIRKVLSGVPDNSKFTAIEVAMDVTITLPENIPKPVPSIAQFIFVFPPWVDRSQIPADANLWKKQLLEAGWGYAEIIPTTLQADNGSGLTSGIIGLANKGGRRTPGQWGAIRAWAWGASNLMDYLEGDQDIDQRRVGISGHSRYGKTALVTMAYDPRFAVAFISSSGAGGASLFRRNYGELLENVAGEGEYHWMAGRFIRYASELQWDDLPADAHELIALCAPRPVFIGSGNVGDQWTDPKGMFLAVSKAGPVYELLGKDGLGSDEFPAPETTLADGELAFRQHNAGHTPAPNWPFFISFAKKYLK
jgi:hypothetical protein